MKRFALTLVVIMMALVLRGQGDCFHFVGIPIEGDISTFNQEMLKHDFTRSNPDQNEGTYIYKGTFEGEQSYVFVQYDTQTTFVYRVVALITRPSKELILEKYRTICQQVEAKYAHSEGLKVLEVKKEKFDSVMHGRAKNPYEWKCVAYPNGYETTTLMIPDHSGNILGDITIFVNESPSSDSRSTDYNLYIQHTVWKSQE